MFDSCQIGPDFPCPDSRAGPRYRQPSLQAQLCDSVLVLRLPSVDTSCTIALFDLSQATTGDILPAKYLVEIEDPTHFTFAYDAGFLIASTSAGCTGYDLRFCEPYTGVRCATASFLIREGAASAASICGRLACIRRKWTAANSLIYDLADRKVLCSLPLVGHISWIDSTQFLIEAASCVFHVDLLNPVLPPPRSPASATAPPSDRFIEIGLMARKDIKDKATTCFYRGNADNLRAEICSLLRVQSFDALHRHELKLSSVSSFHPFSPSLFFVNSVAFSQTISVRHSETSRWGCSHSKPRIYRDSFCCDRCPT